MDNKRVIMNHTLFFILLAIVTGALIPVQAAMNTTLNKTTGSPVVTGTIVFAIGLLAMLAFLFLSKPSLATHVFKPRFIHFSVA